MAVELRCSQVWGGASAVDQTLALPGLDAAIFSRPADGTVGGDIHLVGVCDAGMLCKVVLADLAGHGHRLAEVSGRLQRLLRDNINEHTNDSFLLQLNRQFDGSEGGDRVVFATLACASYFPPDREFCFAYAGHPQIILRRDGRFEPLSVRRRPDEPIANIPIGVERDAAFGQACIRLADDDWLILFTDGVIEARNADGQQYGLARLIHDMGRLAFDSPAAVKNGVLTRLRRFADPLPLDQDDLTLIVLRVRGQSATAASADAESP